MPDENEEPNSFQVPSPGVADKLRRLLWSVVQATLYAWSPTVLHGWRRALLRIFGAQIASGAHPYPSARIWAPWNLIMRTNSCLGPHTRCYNVATISLGANAVVSQYAYLCSASHDHHHPDFPLIARPIEVGDGAWVAAAALVGPGATIGPGAVIGAGAVIMKDAPPGMVLAGNPAKVVGRR